MSKTTDWSVALSVLEPTQLVLANVAHHLELGAKQAFVFLDRPQPDLEAILSKNPKVTFFVCDASYWKTQIRKRRPDKVIFRQIQNARFAMTKCSAQWLLHLDADEFLYPTGDFVQELAHLPGSFGGLLLENYERAFRAGRDDVSIFDGVFRSFPKTEPHGAPWPGFFGADKPFARFGFTAHNLGKSFARNDPKFSQGLHKVRLETGGAEQPLANMYCSTQAKVLHFDGLTRLHWVRKLLRMMQEQSGDLDSMRTKVLKGARGKPKTDPVQNRNTPRQRQIAMLQERAGDPAALIEIHDAHKGVSAQDQESLTALGLLHEIAFDPTQAIGKQFPTADFDLGQAFFDRALTAEFAPLQALYAQIYGTP